MECERCGECCRDKAIPKTMWLDYGSYTPQQKELLMSKRREVDSGCELLDGNDCIVWRDLGREALPDKCSYPPIGKTCFYQRQRKGLL